MLTEIQVPRNFNARAYQKNLFNALSTGIKRGIVVWHRRAGKDKTFISILAKEACKRVGAYFYILPYYKQARKIIWEGMDKDGFRMLDHIPKELIVKKNNQDMTIELQNGSIITFLGSDNIDSIVGTNPVGVIFSEFSLHKVDAWNYLRPILLENGGWALFNGTPRGKNHFYTMYRAAKKDPSWFHELLTIDETHVMTKEQVEQEIANGMPSALAKQEFYCSFDAAMTGAYYDEAMVRMDQEGRIKLVPYEPNLEVHTAWDLGISDMMVILCYQQIHREIRIIDTIADHGKGLEYYVKELKNRGYVYGVHHLPHDIKVRELTNDGKSRFQTLQSLLGQNAYLNVVPRASLEDGINTTRTLLNRVWIDSRQDTFIEALKTYRANWDPERQIYDKPVHDWSSNWADAMRMLAQGVRDPIDQRNLPAIAEGTGYDPLRFHKDISNGRTNKQQSWNPRDFSMAADYPRGRGLY